MHLQEEIAQQPGVIERLLHEGKADTQALAAVIRAHDPAFVCIAARGTSDNAARYAQYLFGHALALPVMLATPSLHTLYRQPPELSRALVIGISQSGAAEDVRRVLADAKRQGALTVALTNVDDSPLATSAAHHLPLRAGQETSVAATKTYTAQLTLIAMLASALAGDSARWSALAQLPQLARGLLSNCESIAGWVEAYADSQHLVTLGRGFNFATACEISLKVKELCYIASEGYSAADFRHGPIAAIYPGHPVILVAPRGATFASMQAIALQLQQRGAELLVISDEPALLDIAAATMPIPALPEWLSPILAVLPGQVYAMQQALALGYDVDRPRGLSKVTITR